MRTERVPLGHAPQSEGGADRPLVASLRELTGGDEIAIDGVDTRAAIDLLQRLLRSPLEGTPPIDAAGLAACDRDALLATLHRWCWGDAIVATLKCVDCDEQFDLSFELSTLQRHLWSNASRWRRSQGKLVCEDGAVIGVPSGRDETTAAAHGARRAVEELAALCGVLGDAIETASVALECGAPILDLDLFARCPECGHEQTTQFEVQSFVLQRLLDERPALLAHVHLLAAAYGWSCGEIFSLSRSTRQALAELIVDAGTPTCFPRHA